MLSKYDQSEPPQQQPSETQTVTVVASDDESVTEVTKIEAQEVGIYFLCSWHGMRHAIKTLPFLSM